MAQTLLMPKATCRLARRQYRAVIRPDRAVLQTASARGQGDCRRRSSSGHQGSGIRSRRVSCRATKSSGRRRIRTTNSSFPNRRSACRIPSVAARVTLRYPSARSPERHSLAGTQPSRTEGRTDFASRRHDQVDDRADPRAHPLELDEPRTDWIR